MRPHLNGGTLEGEEKPMVWTIHSWSVDRCSGTIASPHFGPIPFDTQANVDQVSDFQAGEAVLVELDGDAPYFRVLLVRPMCQRQPNGTHWPPFDAVNSRFNDARVESQSSESVQFWLGDCCEHCTPNAIRLRFEDVTSVVGLDEDVDFSSPLFRVASLGEVEANSLRVPSDHQAFCVVTSHGQGVDGPSIFIVARTAKVVQRQHAS